MGYSPSFIYAFFFSLFYYFPCFITAQQPYLPNVCRRNDNIDPLSVLGYSCNGVNKSCQSFLIYRTQPPYNTIHSIASLLSANASQISAINNNITEHMALATNTEVIVPVTCSCSGRVYQANTTHIVKTDDNYYTLANNTFEGLTTCKAIRLLKVSPNVVDIFPPERLTIPLRCACPTTRQVNKGIRYLMTFVVQQGNDISSIAIKFGADVGLTLEANKKSEQDPVIQPFTTLLVPLHDPPNGSQMQYSPYVPPSTSPLPSLPPTATPPSPQSSNWNSSRNWVFFGLGLVVGAAFVLVVVFILLFMLPRTVMRKEKSQSIEAEEKALVKKSLANETESQEFLENISRIASVKVYTFRDLQAATEDFNSDHWIKGSIHKGNINGDVVAIKKIDGDVSREISVLNKINHFNLIRLLGVCFDHETWYCVYEYAGNGPLCDWIFQDNPNGKSLSWGKRMQVAFDVATGLNYLHSYTSPPLVHKDIQSNNVFLNNEFRAKIAKFGLSRSIRGNNGQFTLTKHIEGRKGYLAPEYLENGVVSPMLDVYAFGVLLLEMLTGKDVALLYEGVKVHLSEVLNPVLSDKDGFSNVKDFIDTSLGEDYPADIAYTMLVLIDRCLRKDPGSPKWLLIHYVLLSSLLIYLPCLITAQHPYGDENCPDYNNATSALGYDYNGANTTCQSFLIYRTQPPYNTISSIASLLSANATQMLAISNNISENMALATNTQVIVPVTCSCSGRFYQANATYVVETDDNPYVITNNVFRGLTTCNAIQTQKTNPNLINVFPDESLTIPLKCACPTISQFNEGIRYLMSFVIQPGNAIASIANKFGANLEQTFEANEKSEQDDVIQPFTMLLVPLRNPPNGSVMKYPAYVPPPLSSPPSLPPTVIPSPPSSRGRSDRNLVFLGRILFYFICMRKKSHSLVSSQSFEAQENACTEPPSETDTRSLDFLDSISKIASMKVHSFKDLQAATNNFSTDHWIKVLMYKGNLNGNGWQSRRWMAMSAKRLYFVYEYAENGALSDWIYQDNPDKRSLSWGKRMQLYKSTHVHKDIKSSNIFLDQEFRVKIAKFGFSRPVKGNDGQFTLTKHIEGTKGYLAPEYLENGIVSPMLDVYAFDVLLIEMLSGKDVARLYEGVQLSEILGPVLSEEGGIISMKEFIDSSLGKDYPTDVAYTMLMLIDRCLSKEP
ncbi:LysM domain receptor-like kinase 4 [Bienertia sinuspersici]